jgi:hypothetical protein
LCGYDFAMLVYVLDDEVRSDGIFRDLPELASEHHFKFFAESASLREEVDRVRTQNFLDSEAIFIVDHDLKSYETGLQFVRWLRETHEFGLLLPVVMLTGRLPVSEYARSQWDDPFLHCDIVVTKNEAQSPDFDWSVLLANLSARYAAMKNLIADQAMKRIEGLSRISQAVGD